MGGHPVKEVDKKLEKMRNFLDMEIFIVVVVSAWVAVDWYMSSVTGKPSIAVDVALVLFIIIFILSIVMLKVVTKYKNQEGVKNKQGQ